jgi:hypothetical protein
MGGKDRKSRKDVTALRWEENRLEMASLWRSHRGVLGLVTAFRFGQLVAGVAATWSLRTTKPFSGLNDKVGLGADYCRF